MPSFLKGKTTNSDLPNKLKIHFVGLGGAGCNIVEYAMTKKSNAQFTFINQKTNRDIPENVNFIDLSNFKSNPYYSGFAMSPEEFYEMEEVVNVFEAKDTVYILFAGLGGVTGSKLCFPILHHLRRVKKLHYLSACLPFNFEGNARSVIANFSKNEIKAFCNHNVHLLDPELLRQEMGALPFKQAFLELDKRIYDIGIGSIINFKTT